MSLPALLLALLACRPGSADVDDANIVAIEVYPSRIVMPIEVDVPLRVVAVDEFGNRWDVEAELDTDHHKIARVEDGRVVARRDGETRVTARYGRLFAGATIEVTSSRWLEIDVIDAETGEALPDAVAWTSGRDYAADRDGHISAVGDGREQSAVTIAADGYIPATLFHVAPREFTVRLRPDPGAAETVRISGKVDLAEVRKGGAGDKIVGLAATSLVDGALFVDVGDLFAETREVEVSGFPVQAPENVYIEGSADTWAVDAEAAHLGVWTLAGPLPVAKLASDFEGVGTAMSLMADHLDQFAYTWVGGIDTLDGEPVQMDLKPWAPFDHSVVARVPESPFDDDPLLLVLQDESGVDGPAVTGLGVGEGDVDVRRVDDDAFTFNGVSEVVALAQDGGLGVGATRLLARAPIRDGAAALPPWQDAPVMGRFELDGKRFDLVTDDRAHVVWVTITSRDGRMRDLYLPSGAFEGEIPGDDVSMGWGDTTWTVHAVETAWGTYEHLLVDGELDPIGLEYMGRSSGITSREIISDER